MLSSLFVPCPNLPKNQAGHRSCPAILHQKHHPRSRRRLPTTQASSSSSTLIYEDSHRREQLIFEPSLPHLQNQSNQAKKQEDIVEGARTPWPRSLLAAACAAAAATAFHRRRSRPARATVVTFRRFSAVVRAAAAASATAPAPVPSVPQTKECSLPTWAEFELGKAPVYWKTTNGLPPAPGEGLKIFYNPGTTKMTPNEQFGIAFNGGFNQPIMCGGEPRQMTLQERGKADPPIYTIRKRIPQHAMTLVFSFTNGSEWDGAYTLKFKVPKPWLNKPLSFFNEGLVDELNMEGACDRAIFLDENIVITSCDIGGFYEEGGDRCKLDIVSGCMDPTSHMFDPLATIDDGSCPLDSDSEE